MATGDIALALIDGTGPAGGLYDQVMKDSFCRQIAAAYGLSEGKGYWRGPTDSGAGLGKAVEDAVAFVSRGDAGREGGPPIILVGYSRGGLGVILAAEKLKARKRDVHAMILLDPVDRYMATAPYKPIPNNVRHSFRAFRSTALDVVLKWENKIPNTGSLANRAKNTFARNPMRPGFSSAGLGFEAGPHSNPINHKTLEPLAGSHGAMGGSGYKWIGVDWTCQEALIDQLTTWWGKVVGRPLKLTPGWDTTVPDPARIEDWGDRALLVVGRTTTMISLTFNQLDHVIANARQLGSKAVWQVRKHF